MTQAANLGALGTNVNSSGITQAAGGGTAGTAGVTGFKNRIINGAMVIDQRNAGASVTASTGTYTLDRWRAYSSQASKFTVQQNAGSVTPPVGFSNYLGITSSSAYSSGASDLFVMQQLIEGFNTADLGWGTANAKTVTLSFQVYSSLTGTFSGSFMNSGATRSYPFSYSIPVANTWTSISVTVAGDTTGTWVGATNGIGIRLNWNLGSGSSNLGTANAWAGAEVYGVTGSVSVVGTNGATWFLTGVQLEVGSTATSFDYRPYQTELNLCYRYCFALRTDSSGYTNYGRFPPAWTVSTTNANFDLFLPTPMRNTSYSLTYNNKQYELYFITGGGSTGQGGSTMSLNTDANGLNWVNITLTATSPGTWLANQIGGFRFTNALDAAIIISTEL